MISITKIMPDGVILDGLTLDESTATEPIMFRARAKSKDIAEELKHSFQASSLFTDVYFQNISQEKTGDYPFTINLSAKLNPKAEVKS